MNELRRVGRAGERDAGDARVGDRRRADRGAVAWQEMQHVRRYARLQQQAHGLRRHERCLLGRLGDHRVAGGQCRGNLPAKMASGKFQGLMQANTPRPCSDSSLLSPVGPGMRTGAPKSARARAA